MERGVPNSEMNKDRGGSERAVARAATARGQRSSAARGSSCSELGQITQQELS